MTKRLKPLKILVDDAREGDIVRIVYKKSEGISGEHVGYYWPATKFRANPTSLPSLVCTNHIHFTNYLDIDSRLVIHVDSIEEEHSDVRGYEILRRARRGCSK